MWSDSYRIRDLLGGLQQLGWTRTAWTPTAWLEPELELVSRTDVVGLFLDPELELIYSSRTDVVGLVCLDPTAGLEPDLLGGLQQLGWTRDLLGGLLDSDGLDW